MLRPLGINELGEQVYRLLLAEPDAGTEEVSRRLRLTRDEFDETLAGLRQHGLLSEYSTQDPVIRPVHPAIALDPLLASARVRLRAHRQSIALAAEAVVELSTLVPQGNAVMSQEVQLNQGQAAAFSCLERIAATAQRQVSVLASSGPAPVVPDATEYGEVMRLAVTMAQRGVHLRVILLDSIKYLAPLVESAQWIHQAGVEIRTAPTLPVWTFVVDGDYVVTALDPADHDVGNVLVRAPGALAGAAELFTHCWQAATELDDTQAQDETVTLTTAQHRLLVLIVNGTTDASIARKFSVSERTIRRQISELYGVAGVSSRTQLAFRAAKLGWLDGSELDRF